VGSVVPMWKVIKAIVLWNYPRGAWQWDTLCLLIIVFIFTTPKSWFEKREKLATQTPSAAVKPIDYIRFKGNDIFALSGTDYIKAQISGNQQKVKLTRVN
jgi:hypothetical protein